MWEPGEWEAQAKNAQAKNAQDQFSPSVSADVTIGEYLAEGPGLEVLQGSPGPPGLKEPWQARASMNANCRAEPGVEFNEIGFVPKGYTAVVLGRNEAGTWL